MKKEIIIGIFLGLFVFIIFSNLNKKQSQNTPVTTSNTPSTPSPTIEENKPLDPKLIDDTVIENLQIGNKKYSFINGQITKNGDKKLTEEEKQKVRSLVFFYLKVKEDPLFTSPDFDKNAFKNSLNLLEKGANEFQTILGKNKPIFPISFLKTIPDVKDKENIFLDKPSYQNAQNLLNSYKKTAFAYQNEADTFVDFLKTNQSKIKDTNYILINTVLSKQVFYRDLDKLLRNSKALEEEVNKRQDCLEKGVNCARFIANLEKPKLEKAPEEKFTLLPLDILFPSISSFQKETIKGPFIVKSPCWGMDKNLNPVNQPFYLIPTAMDLNKQGEDLLHIKLASNNYYRVIGTMEMDKEAIKYGIAERIPQPETFYYMCTDLEYQPKLLTIYGFMEQFKNKNLFAKIDEKDIPKDYLAFWRKADNFEKDFFASEIPNEADLETLSSAYLFAYKILPSNNEFKDRFLQRYSIINRRLTYYNTLLNFSTTTFNTVANIVKKDKSSFESEEEIYSYFYPFRSLWNLLYFPFSSSFWRLSEKPEYLKKINVDETDLKKKLYINYQQALKLYDAKTIKSWQINYLRYLKDNLK